jgi:hypothetical protein
MYQCNPDKHTDTEKNLFALYADYWNASVLPIPLKLSNFTKYVRRQDLSRFLAKLRIFESALTLPGVVVECGCYAGGGLMTWAQLSAIFEPYNHTRRIIGFDTMSGFPAISEKDISPEKSYQPGDLSIQGDIEADITQSIRLYDLNRPLSHIKKVDLVVGDATETIPAWIAKNPHAVVSLLYLDFDLYEPTKAAILHLVPRMPRGGIIAFDELNAEVFPGETMALLDTLGINHLPLRKTPFDAYICFSRIP